MVEILVVDLVASLVWIRIRADVFNSAYHSSSLDSFIFELFLMLKSNYESSLSFVNSAFSSFRSLLSSFGRCHSCFFCFVS